MSSCSWLTNHTFASECSHFYHGFASGSWLPVKPSRLGRSVSDSWTGGNLRGPSSIPIINRFTCGRAELAMQIDLYYTLASIYLTRKIYFRTIA